MMHHRTSIDENTMMTGVTGAKRYNDVPRPMADKRQALVDVTNHLPAQHDGLRRVDHYADLNDAHNTSVPSFGGDSYDDSEASEVEMMLSPEPMSIETVPAMPMHNFIDIDALDHQDVFKVTEYVNDIHSHWKNRELDFRPVSNYLESVQRDVTANMRAVLMDWLVEVQEEYKFQPETFYLAINYIDRYLSCEIVPRTRLQLLGVACMMLAAKYEEIHPPMVDDFVYITDNTYNREEVVKMEYQVLLKLKFDLTVATPYVFMQRYLKCAGADRRISMLALYFLELTTQEYHFIRYLPSEIAASCVCLAMHTTGNIAWSATMSHYTGFAPSHGSIVSCTQALFNMHHNIANSKQEASREKFSHSKYERASTIAPASEMPFVQ